MSVTPTSSLAVAEYLLRRMVAASATFQAAAGVESADDAYARIFLKDFDFDEPRPCACISTVKLDHQLIAGGNQNQLRPNGSLFLYLSLDTPEEFYDDEINNHYTALNYVGGVADDVAAIAGQDQTDDDTIEESQLAVTNQTLLFLSETPREKWQSLGRFWIAGLQIDWGDGS